MALCIRRAIPVGLALMSFCASTPQARQFRSADGQPAEAPSVQAVAYMSTLLSQRTGGHHGIDVVHGSQDSENFMAGQVRIGRLDMARVNLGVFNSTVPATTIPSLPFLFKSVAHMRHVLDGPVGDEILASMEDEGFIGLCFYDMGTRSYYSADGPIRRPADLRGRSVRVQPSELAADVVRAIGGKPMPLPADRVAAALKTGTVDVADNSWTTYVASGHYRVARYYSLTEHSMMPGVLVFSKRVWSELTPADRVALRATAKESVRYLRFRLDDYQVAARLKAEQSGVEVIDDVDRASFADAIVPLYSKLVRDPRLRVMISQIQADSDVGSVP